MFGAILDGIFQFAPQLFLARDALGDGIPRAMRLEGKAKQSLVEMDMPVHKSRGQQRSAKIDRLQAGMLRRADRRDAAVFDMNVRAATVRQGRVGEYRRRHGINPMRRAATT
jgi:hypothetical protein